MECESGIRNVKKYMIISLRLSYQHTIRNHPIFMAMLCFLVLLNTLFPVLFSFLLYISPVVICTALLLGTLLSYGQTTYIPEHDVGVDVDDTGVGVSTDSVNIVERDGGIKYVRLEDDDDVPIAAGNLQVDEKGGDYGVLDDSEPRNETEFLDDQDVVGIQYAMLSKDGVILEDGSGGHQLDDTHVDDDNDNEEEGDNEEDEDESSISRSSTSESSASASVSSPDDSMADIMPMLDELHPLLDLEAPQPAHISHDSSDAEESEDDNGDEEEKAHDDDDKESGHKSAITWTEDDQKNLIDLGTSELERNLRLENLIARRRARRLVVEKNVIDLDSADPPHNMAPISTVRGNPFDSIYDLYDNNPIPGSAPSIMLPRKNPFDIPYDSSEEKPNLTGDSFQQEFKKTFPHKDAFFRRHESFSVGSSAFGGSRHASNWRPFFVPEKLAPDGVNYHLFQRQSSGYSDSKASSNPETGSISSSADEEEKTLIEHDFPSEIAQPDPSVSADQISNHAEIGSDADHADFGSDANHSDIGSGSDHADVGSDSAHGELRSVLEQAKLGNDSDHVESGSDSSEHSDIDDEAKMKMEDVENHQETEIEMNLVTSRERSYDEFVESDVRPNVKIDEEGSTKSRSSSSSSSSSSSDDEVITYKKENTLINSSLEEPNVNSVHDVVEDNQIKDPVYDSSPSAVEKLISFSFSFSDNHEEEAETCLPSTSINSDVLIEDTISDVRHESSARVTPIGEESQEATCDEDVHIPDRISDIHHERIIGDGTSIGEYSQEITSNALVAGEVSDVHHESIDSVTSIDKNLLGAASTDVLFADKVADDHDSSYYVTSIDEESREATLDADALYVDNVSDVHNERSIDHVTSIADTISDVHHESSDCVTSIDKNLFETTSGILFADKASDDHEINDPVPPIHEDLQEAASDVLFADKIFDAHCESPDHVSTIDEDLQKATADVLFVDKISDVHHESSDHGISTDIDLQEATSGAILGDKICDVHISDCVTSIDEDSLEAVSDVAIEDETSDVNHESSDHVTIIGQNMQETTSDVSAVDKISDLNHGSSDPVGSADEDSQEATSTVIFANEVSDVHHRSSDPVASTDKDLQEATSAVGIADKVSDVHHESSDNGTSIEEESLDASMHAEDEK